LAGALRRAVAREDDYVLCRKKKKRPRDVRIITRTWKLVDWLRPLAFGSWLQPLAFTSRLALGFWLSAFGTWLSALVVAWYLNNEVLRRLVKHKHILNCSPALEGKVPSASAANLAKLPDASESNSTGVIVSAVRSLRRSRLRDG